MPHRPRAVLLASSANVYGNARSRSRRRSLPAPANDYAVSKLAMEYMACSHGPTADRHHPAVQLYGGRPDANFLIPKIVGHFQRRERVIELGNIDVERDFSDVRTIARIYSALLQKAPAGDVFNVCSGKVYSLKEVLAMVADIAGYEIEVRVNPAFVRINEVKRLQGDAGKLRQAIGDFQAIPLQETLRWMYANV